MSINVTQSGLYRLLLKQEPSVWMAAVALAAIAGLLQGGIVLLINQIAGSLHAGGLQFRLLLLIALTITAYGLASYYAVSTTISLSENAIYTKYFSIAEKLRKANTLDFEGIGKSRIYATLQTNVDIITETSKSLASVGAAVVMIAFCALYIAFMSTTAFILVIVFYLFGIFVFTSNLKRLQNDLTKAVSQESEFIGLFHHFLEGFKEIKVSPDKGEDLYDNYLNRAAEVARETRIGVENSMAGNSVFVQAFYYAMIASMLLLLPHLGDISLVNIVKISAVVLFSYGSVSRIVQSIPMILKSESAITLLDRLEADLQRAEESDASCPAPIPNVAAGVSITLQDVYFRYPADAGQSPFALGPLSFDIKAGEVVFIVGGNGGGKTTLLKILCGLYRAQAGTLFANGVPVMADSYGDYKRLFSAIFTDFCLFDRFYGIHQPEAETVRQLLVKMGLEDHVSWKDGRFTHLKLSAGQRKRLALLTSHVESSPVLAVDEVAADLDPDFRRYFYETYLNELRAAGKTVVAVSHDEQFFHVADRIITCVDGMVVSSASRVDREK